MSSRPYTSASRDETKTNCVEATSSALQLNGVGNSRAPSFECSYELDKNSISALQADDDEDQVHHATSSFLTRQKVKQQDRLKEFKPGKNIAMNCDEL